MLTQITKKTAMLTAFGAGLMALPFALPSTARADDFRIHLNLGAPAYVQPQRVVYRDYYRPAPQRVVYVQQPRRVVYVSRPVYRERVVYNDWNNGWHGGRGHGEHGRGHWEGRGRWNDRDHRVAWR